jgi:hypothetical protein
MSSKHVQADEWARLLEHDRKMIAPLLFAR